MSFRTSICLALVALVVLLGGCTARQRPSGEVVFVIDSNPANLDPRMATDAQSQRIIALIFSGLAKRDENMNLTGDLAESWENPDPLTYIFHLRKNVLFHDGKPVTSADVKATFEFMLDPANKSPKRGAFRMVTAIEAPDPATVVFRLKEPYASFVWNLARPAIGIVPANAGADFSKHLVGSGPFRFVSQQQDDSVVLERSTVNRVSDDKRTAETQRIVFRIVPDAIVRALELRKGSADVEVSSLSPDMIPVLSRQPALAVTERSGTNFAYLGLNLEDPILAHREVRQALAYATDRDTLIKYLLHGQAQIASGILPPEHWAFEPDVQKYGYDPARAEQLLDAAGYPRKPDGTRLHLLLKVSTQEQARLIGAALQDQWKRVGIALEVRPQEIATLFSDLAKGNFQLSYSNWVGANNDPDVFEFVFSSKRMPPDGANRGHYRNTQIDSLTDQIRVESDPAKRRVLCSEAQKILAIDLPYIPLWYVGVVSVHNKDLTVQLTPTGDYEFLAN